MFSLSFVGGSKSAEEGPNPLVYFDRGGGVHIRQRIWTGGSISASGFGPGGPNLGGVQILWDTGIFKTPKDIDDFTNCPTHRSNLGVGWNRGSNSRCRVPKEMPGHGKGRVKSIPKADGEIGKCVSQIVLKMSGIFVQSGFGK